ncbi:metallophosphoesterase [Paenibacillus larvae]|nr:metallophosphoesterase [Paenibacillus larvae]MDT2236498.1 metallophosphoesterase [Paenibacillus larvae]
MTAIQPFTFIHAADLHLDSPFKGMSGLPGAVRERIKESTFAALERLVHAAFREKADFVVISGDIYDAADRSLRAQLRFKSCIPACRSGNRRIPDPRQSRSDERWQGFVGLAG